MRLQFAVLILTSTVMLANSTRHHQPPVPSPSSSSSAPAPAPAPAVDCSSLLGDMIDCIEYLLTGSNDTKVSSTCCSGFESVVDMSANCVCEGMNIAAGLGYQLNVTRIMDLPRACKVTVPPSVKNCKISQAPDAGPAGPPDSLSPELPPEEPPTSPSTEPPTSPSTEPPTSPSTEPPSQGSAPSSTPGGSSSASAPSPSTGAANSIAISLLGLISMLLVSSIFVLV